MSRLAPLAALLLVLATGLCACDGDASEPSPDESSTPRANGRTSSPPPTVTVELPSFPPLGPRAKIAARLTGSSDVVTLDATFRRRTTNTVTLRSGVGGMTFGAQDLGEGRGTLVLEACDLLRSSCSGTSVENLIVDLTPPELEVERRVASPSASGPAGEVSVWVADDWVLGRVSFTFGGKTFERTFPATWPNTLGQAWDVSRVGFAAKDLPEGTGDATFDVEDAAGNRLERTFTIRVDGTPPAAAMSAPAAGTRVSRGAPLAVRASASDPNDGAAPVLEVWIGGARIAELPGPTIDLDVDTRTLPEGPLEVRVVPRDEAGNVGAPVSRTVMVE
jgi:hypothetical protein